MKIAPKESLTFDESLRPRDKYPVRQLLCQLLPGPLQRPSGHRRQRPSHSGVGTVDGLLGQEAYSPDGVTLDHYPYPQMRLYVKKITESYQHYSEIYK